jgi:hypothetical protein
VPLHFFLGQQKETKQRKTDRLALVPLQECNRAKLAKLARQKTCLPQTVASSSRPVALLHHTADNVFSISSGHTRHTYFPPSDRSLPQRRPDFLGKHRRDYCIQYERRTRTAMPTARSSKGVSHKLRKSIPFYVVIKSFKVCQCGRPREGARFFTTPWATFRRFGVRKGNGATLYGRTDRK